MKEEKLELGWQKNEKGEWEFHFSDCVVSENSIEYGKENGKYEVGFKKHFESNSEAITNDFFRLSVVIASMPKVLYPVLITNVAALLYPIWQQSTSHGQGIILWLYGTPGSGKTEIAINLASYVNKEKLRSEFESLASANASTGDLGEILQEHQGLNFILDDAKNERVYSQREKLRRNLDTIIRSVFSFRLTDAFRRKRKYQGREVKAGLVITGEVIDLEKSSISRCVFLDIGNFVNTRIGSESLNVLQEHPEYLVGSMVGFIQFLAHQWNNGGLSQQAESFKKLDKSKLAMSQKQGAARLKTARNMLTLCHGLWVQYAAYLGTNWKLDSADLMKTVKNTEDMLISPDDIFEIATERVLKKLIIKKAKCFLTSALYKQDRYLEYGFLMPEKTDALYLNELKELPGLEKLENDEEVLFAKRDVFLKKLEKEIQREIEKMNFANIKMLNGLLGKLHAHEIILGKKRRDGLFDYALWYPTGYDEDDQCQCILLNTKNLKVKQALGTLPNEKVDINIQNLSWEEQEKIDDEIRFKYSRCCKSINKAMTYKN